MSKISLPSVNVCLELLGQINIPVLSQEDADVDLQWERARGAAKELEALRTEHQEAFLKVAKSANLRKKAKKGKKK